MQEVYTVFEKFYPEILSQNKRVVRFTTLQKELDIITEGVGIRNISDRNVIALYGKDVLEYLNRLSTNEVKSLPIAGVRNTLFTNEKGRFIDRTQLISFEGKHLLVSNCSCDTRIKNWIEKYIITEEIKTESVTGQYLILEFYGEQKDSYLTLFCGDTLNQVNDQSITLITYEDVHFFLYLQKEVSGVEKYILISPAIYSSKIVEHLLNNKSVFDVSFIGDEAYEVFRIFNGIPVYPNELNDLYNPHEANLLSEVSFNKGCYIGQEVIARLDTYDKVQKNLMGITIDANILMDLPEDLFDSNGTVVGTITSKVKHPFEHTNYGLAYIRKAYCQDGAELLIKTEKEEKVAIVKNLPMNL